MGSKIKSIAQLALPYVLIAILPILSIIALCGYIIQSYTQAAVEMQNATLNVAVERVDEKLNFLEREAFFLTNRTEFQNYFRNQFLGEPNEILNCTDVQKLLQSYARDEGVAQVYFYDAQCGRVIA